MAFQMPSFVSKLMRPFSSTSMHLQPDSLSAMNFPPNTQKATYAGGCFWGTEELYRKNFGKGKGLLDCRVGYTGGNKENPSYEEVCTGRTGHAEALLLVFDPDTVSYRQLTEFFFKMHDPTTLNRQGADTGTQYRSGVYANSEEQLKIAQELKEKVGKEWYKGKTITTEVKVAGPWYDADAKHQDYLGDEDPYKYKCPAHYVRPFPALSE